MRFSIRKMTLFGLGLCIGAFFLLFFFLQHAMLDRDFADLETAFVTKNVVRAENVVRDEVQKLDDTVVDWALWDDTVAFLNGTMPGYVDVNLNERSIAALRLAFILFLNNGGDVVWAQSLTPAGKYDNIVPEGLRPYLRPKSPLLRATNEKERAKGLLRTTEGVVLAASCPVLDSEGKGPKQGTLIMGRRLNQRLAEEIAERTRLDVSFAPAGEPLPPRLAAHGLRAELGGASVVPIGADLVAGASVMPDIFGQPALQVLVRQPRDIVNRGNEIVNQTGLLLSIGGMCLFVVLVTFVERRVLARLAALTGQVDAIAADGAGLGRVATNGDDELGVLAQHINDMLAEIEHSRQELSRGYAEKKAQEAYLRQILDSIQAGVLLVDPESRRVVEVNRFAAKVAGRSREDILGRVCFGLICPPQGEVCPMARPDQSQDLAQRFLIRFDGTLVPILKSVSRIQREGHEYFLETFIDVHELHEARAALVASEERLSHIIDTLPIGIFQTTPDDRCQLANPSLARMLGYADPSALMAAARNVSRYYVDPAQYRALRAVLDAEGRLADCTVQLRRTDGQTIWVNISAMAHYDAAGAVSSYVGFVQDITRRREIELELERHRNNLEQLVRERTAALEAEVVARRRAQEELLQAKLAAESANKTKSAFLANMSHEIRTPLNGVLGMLQLLEQTALDEDQRDSLETAIQAANRLTNLLSDILDLSRVEADKLALREEPFALVGLKDSILSLFQTMAWKKGLKIACTLDAQLPPLVVGDESRLRQILFNLVGNAIKFTETGEVRLDMCALPDASPSVARVLFVVSDTGVGISDEDLRHIFEPFVQADATYTRHAQGAGLGLAIVRKLVALMGGTLTIDNAPEGGGTAFYLSLPLVKAEAEPEAVAVASEDAAVPARSGRILVVDDDTVSLAMVTRFLAAAGYTTVAAGNGREALDRLGDQAFDLVLLDVQMPVMNGIDAVKAMRRATLPWGNARIPVFAMSAYAMAGDRETFLAAGMDAAIAKPLDLRALLGLIDRTLAGTSGAAPVTPPAA